MRTVLPALLIVLGGEAQSLAQPRAPTNRMSCSELADSVRRDGEVRLPTAAGTERIVRDRSFCDILEIAELRFLSTRDNPQCAVGYRCRAPDYEDWNWD